MNHSDHEVIKLLSNEKCGMLYAASINTISFFHGHFSLEGFQSKLLSIVLLNPWLLSTLVRPSDNEDVVAIYSTDKSALRLNDCFQVLENSFLNLNLSNQELLSHVSSSLVPVGVVCINKGTPLFKVSLITIKPNEKFALVMSLSHTLGDGNTFYNIYNMLDCDSQVRALDCMRQFSFEEQLIDATGVKLQDWITSQDFSQGITNTLSCGVIPSVCCFTLNKTEIERIKDEYSSKNSGFISTNDIVSSWFMNLCRATFGMIVLNFRSRFSDLTDDLAGNYHSLLVYDHQSYASPEQIRKSMTTYNKNETVPTREETLEFHSTMVSNWCAFYRDINLLGNCKFVSHFPLYNAVDINFHDVCIVFKMNEETPAVMFLTRSSINLVSLVEACDPSVCILQNRVL